VRQLATVTPADRELLRELAAEYHREGSHAAVMGYALAARFEYQAELVVLQRLAQDHPQEPGVLRDLAAVHRVLAGRAERDGDYAAVQREQLAEVAVLRQLALADPVSGELLRTAMDGAAAAGPGGEPATAEPAPPDPEAQCRALTELADRALAAGDRDTAEVSLQALAGLRARLAAASPGQVQAQLDLADAHRRLSDCYAAGGKAEAAHRSGLAEVAVLGMLAAASPADADRQNVLARGYGRLASLAGAAGQPAAARAAARAEVIIRSWLAAAHPVSWRLDALAEAEARLAGLAGPEGTASG
jgi:hypothetical protein